jgi:DNA-binding GntR family transcriptional regulator
MPEAMTTKTRESWPSLETTTLTDQVFTVLRDRILTGHVAPGEFVREQDVSDAVGVSRTPVREALGRLASEGFLERIAHRGFRVPEGSIADLLEIYPILTTLEVLAGQDSFPLLEPADLAELKQINTAYARAAEKGDFQRGIELNDEFHHALSRAAGNERLVSMLDDLRQTVRRLETWTFTTHPRDWSRSVSEHQEIIDHLAAGTFDAALEVLRANRMMTYETFQTDAPTVEDSAWKSDG